MTPETARAAGAEASTATPAFADNAAPDALLESLLAIRDPLCRAELATSQIPTNAEPYLVGLHRDVCDAIREIDERIEVLVAGLRGPDPTHGPLEDPHSVLNDILDRMAPVLLGRGVEVEVREPDITNEPERWHEPSLRRLVLIALRVALATLPRGGRVVLERCENRTLRVHRWPRAADAAPLPSPSDDALEPLREVALELGGWLELEVSRTSGLPVLCVRLGTSPLRGPMSGAPR